MGLRSRFLMGAGPGAIKRAVVLATVKDAARR